MLSCDFEIFKGMSVETWFVSIHPLHKQVPKAKVIDYNLRYKNSARTLINTKHFEDTFINRLIYKYDLHM